MKGVWVRVLLSLNWGPWEGVYIGWGGVRGIIDGRDVGGSGPINFRGWERSYPWVSEAPMDMDPPSPYAKSCGRRFTVKESGRRVFRIGLKSTF